MSNVFSDPAADAIDVTLVEALELLQADLGVLRAHVIEVMDDYRAVCRRSAELSAAPGGGIMDADGTLGVDELSGILADLASELREA
jgi:hypothetical protein